MKLKILNVIKMETMRPYKTSLVYISTSTTGQCGLSFSAIWGWNRWQGHMVLMRTIMQLSPQKGISGSTLRKFPPGGSDTIWLGNIPFFLTPGCVQSCIANHVSDVLLMLRNTGVGGGVVEVWRAVAQEEGCDYCHRACVKSLNMSQLGWHRSDRLRTSPSIGTASPLALLDIPAHLLRLITFSQTKICVCQKLRQILGSFWRLDLHLFFFLHKQPNTAPMANHCFTQWP